MAPNNQQFDDSQHCLQGYLIMVFFEKTNCHIFGHGFQKYEKWFWYITVGLKNW
jgi:hypothetical protein